MPWRPTAAIEQAARAAAARQGAVLCDLAEVFRDRDPAGAPGWDLFDDHVHLSLQGQAETDAVLKQIEGTLTEAQQAAIAEMSLTFRDIGTWMQEQGIEMPTPPAGQGAPGQGAPGQGRPGAFQGTCENVVNVTAQ